MSPWPRSGPDRQAEGRFRYGANEAGSALLDRDEAFGQTETFREEVQRRLTKEEGV